MPLRLRGLEMEARGQHALVGEEGRQRKNRYHVRERDRACDRREAERSGTECAKACRETLDQDAARGEENGVDVRRVVVLGMRRDHRREEDQEGEAEGTRLFVREQLKKPGDPDQRQDRVGDEHLGEEILAGREHDVLAVLSVAEDLEHGEAVRRLPEEGG